MVKNYEIWMLCDLVYGWCSSRAVELLGGKNGRHCPTSTGLIYVSCCP